MLFVFDEPDSQGGELPDLIGDPCNLTIDRFKAHLRVDHDFEDGLLNAYLVAAIAHAETIMNRAIRPRTGTLYLRCFTEFLCLDRPDIQTVTGVTYIDPNGQTLVFPTQNVAIEPGALPRLQFLGELPQTADRIDAVQIGLTQQMLPLPEECCQAILLIGGNFYEHRENDITGTIATTPSTAVDALLKPHRHIPI